MKEQSATCGLVSASKPVSKLDQALDLAISLQKIQGQRDIHVPETNPHKVLGTGFDRRGILRGPRATRMGSGLS